MNRGSVWISLNRIHIGWFLLEIHVEHDKTFKNIYIGHPTISIHAYLSTSIVLAASSRLWWESQRDLVQTCPDIKFGPLPPTLRNHSTSFD